MDRAKTTNDAVVRAAREKNRELAEARAERVLVQIMETLPKPAAQAVAKRAEDIRAIILAEFAEGQQ
jgi:hypothetical protein